MTRTVRRLAVVTGGLSEESTTHRLADALTKAVVTRAGRRAADVVVERIVVRDLAHEIASASVTGFASGALSAACATLGEADAVIAVTPTYKASYTGLFKAFWDTVPDGTVSGVPTIIGATGGTARHSLVTETAMRPLFTFMKAVTVPTAVYAAPEDWGQPGLDRRVQEAAHELWDALAPGPVRGQGHAAGEGDAKPGDLTANAVRTLGSSRDHARDPFVGVPTMADMLRE